MTLPECLRVQRMRLVVQGVLQVLAELGGGVVDQGVGEGGGKGVAGVVRAHQPLAHGQGLYAGRCYHVTRAGIHEHLRTARQQFRMSEPQS